MLRKSESLGGPDLAAPSLQFHLLGNVDFDECLSLQKRLAREIDARCDRYTVVLVCEHPEVITVGRNGSRGHIRLTDEQLRRWGLSVRWVSRGGGCILHAPGQLAVYPITRLASHGWTVGEYVRRLQAGVLAALNALGVSAQTRPSDYGVWGRTGLVAAMGVAIRCGISIHGMFVNVHPLMKRVAFIDTVSPRSPRAGGRSAMSCLVAERRRPVRMPTVRAALAQYLAVTFDCERYHLYTGHPWLRKQELGDQKDQTLVAQRRFEGPARPEA